MEEERVAQETSRSKVMEWMKRGGSYNILATVSNVGQCRRPSERAQLRDAFLKCMDK
jgi:hypothetical protein